MKKLIAFCSLLTLSLGFFGCTKTDEPSLRTGYITKGKWVKYAESIEVLGTTTDVYAMLQPCIQDNMFIFNADKSYVYDEGDIKCDPNAPQSANIGSWDFLNADTQIIINSANVSTIYDIQRLNDTAMVFIYKSTTNNVTSTQTIRYHHSN